jgi:hypothetical protein
MRTRIARRLRLLSPATAPFLAFAALIINGHRW